MVRARAWIVSGVLAAWCGAAAASPCTAGTEYEPMLCPFRMPAIQSVTIEQNGAKASIETDPSVDCSSFKLNERLVRRYFVRARLVPPEEGHERLIWSACFAAGTMRLQNGQTARWSISQAKVGSLTVEGKAEQRLYCPACKDKLLNW